MFHASLLLSHCNALLMIGISVFALAIDTELWERRSVDGQLYWGLVMAVLVMGLIQTVLSAVSLVRRWMVLRRTDQRGQQQHELMEVRE